MKHLLIIYFMIMCGTCFSQSGTWIKKNDFAGNARSRGVCFTLKGCAYYGTGNHSKGSSETADMWKYDPTKDKWVQIADLPIGMQAATAAASASKGYVGLGWSASRSFKEYFEYDPDKNKWQLLKKYAGNYTNDATSIGFGGLIYAGFGAQPYSENHWGEWYSFNPLTNDWKKRHNFPGVDRRNAGSFSISNQMGGFIYLGGGQLENGKGTGQDFYKYNPYADAWTSISPCPSKHTAGTRNAGFSIRGRGYFVLADGIWEYDPKSDTWTSYIAPFNKGVDAAFSLGNKAYVVLAGTNEVWEWSRSEPVSNKILPKELTPVQQDEKSDIEKNIPSTSKMNPNAVALIIAIRDYYDEQIPPVVYAKRDAQFIREYLIKTLGYLPENILPKDPDIQMTSGQMKTYIRNKLPSYLKPDGSSDVFIYYVGHGAPSTTEQASFFVPYDCDPNFVNKDNAYRTKDFYNDIAKMNARSKTVVVDACFSGQSGDGKSLVKNASPILVKVNTDLFSDPRTVVFQSSKADQVSNWYPDKKHGMFTYFFLKGLQGAADSNKDNKITAGELENYINDVNNGLPYWSKREFSRPQQAVLNGDKERVIRE
jgi:hypothetical protein